MKPLAWIGGAIIIIALVGGAYYFGTQQVAAPAAENTSGPATWSFAEAGEDEIGAPWTTVTVTYGGTSHDLGSYQGNCSEIKNSAWSLLTGEESGVICWWAGGGTELGIFTENGSKVVKIGVLDEGSAEVAGTRGENLRTILALE